MSNLHYLNRGEKKWKIYAHNIIAREGIDDLILEVSANKEIIFKQGTNSYTLADLTNNSSFTSGSDISFGDVDLTGNIKIGGNITLGGYATLTAAGLAASNYILGGLVPGAVQGNKVLLVDGNKDINGIRNLTIEGVLTDGNYTFDTLGNVTGLGTVSCGAITSTEFVGDLCGNVISSGTSTFTNIGINGGNIDGAIIGTNSPAIGTFTTLTANTSISGTLETAAQPNISTIGTTEAMTTINSQLTVNEGVILNDTLDVSGKLTCVDLSINGDLSSSNLNADGIITSYNTVDSRGLSVAGVGVFGLLRIGQSQTTSSHLLNGGHALHEGVRYTMASTQSSSSNIMNLLKGAGVIPYFAHSDYGAIDLHHIGQNNPAKGTFTELHATQSISISGNFLTNNNNSQIPVSMSTFKRVVDNLNQDISSLGGINYTDWQQPVDWTITRNVLSGNSYIKMEFKVNYISSPDANQTLTFQVRRTINGSESIVFTDPEIGSNTGNKIRGVYNGTYIDNLDNDISGGNDVTYKLYFKRINNGSGNITTPFGIVDGGNYIFLQELYEPHH